MFSGCISQTKQHRVTHPCQVPVVILLTQKQKNNAQNGIMYLMGQLEHKIYCVVVLNLSGGMVCKIVHALIN